MTQTHTDGRPAVLLATSPQSIPVTPRDIRDQHWLDDRVLEIDNGVTAVVDIARNWTENLNLSRLHPGVSAQDYILTHVKHPLGRGVVVPLLEASNWSNVQIGAMAGVSPETVRTTSQNLEVERPAKTLGADGKLRPGRLVREVKADIIEPEQDDVIVAQPPATAPELPPDWRPKGTRASHTSEQLGSRAFVKDCHALLDRYSGFERMPWFKEKFGAVVDALARVDEKRSDPAKLDDLQRLLAALTVINNVIKSPNFRDSIPRQRRKATFTRLAAVAGKLRDRAESETWHRPTTLEVVQPPSVEL